MRVAIVIGATALGLSLAGTARAQGTGRSLDIQPGARENGLGAAGVALPGDPCDAVWWNPAALGFAEWYSGQWTSAKLVPGLADDVRYKHFGVAVPIKGFGGAALGYTRLSYGSSEGADPQGNPTGTFESWESSHSVAAGYRVNGVLAFGLTVKYVRIVLAPSSLSGTASTVGFDFGGLYRQPIAGMTLGLGLNVQNIGPRVSFANEDRSDPLGRNLKVGGAVTVPVPLGSGGFEIGGAAVADYNHSLVTSDFNTWHGGVELYGAFAKWVRVMYRRGYYEDVLGDIGDYTHGAGVRVAGATFDVAWIPQPRNLGLDRLRKITVGLNSDALSSLLSAH